MQSEIGCRNISNGLSSGHRFVEQNTIVQFGNGCHRNNFSNRCGIFGWRQSTWFRCERTCEREKDGPLFEPYSFFYVVNWFNRCLPASRKKQKKMSRTTHSQMIIFLQLMPLKLVFNLYFVVLCCIRFYFDSKRKKKKTHRRTQCMLAVFHFLLLLRCLAHFVVNRKLTDKKNMIKLFIHFFSRLGNSIHIQTCARIKHMVLKHVKQEKIKETHIRMWIAIVLPLLFALSR